MKPIRYFYILTILVTACATPAPIVRLSPSAVGNKEYWNLGQHFIYATDNNILYECGFNRIENNKLIFDVKITNQSDTDVLIDPASFKEEVFGKDSMIFAEYNAFDPELVLLSLNMDQNIQEAKAKNAAVFSICSSIITAGATIAVAASDKKEEEKESAYNTLDAANSIAQTASGEAIESANIRSEKNWTQQKSLSEAFLRKTTLPKGYYIDGEVHFPYKQDATGYNVILKSENSEVNFHFQQTKIFRLPFDSNNGSYSGNL